MIHIKIHYDVINHRKHLLVMRTAPDGKKEVFHKGEWVKYKSGSIPSSFMQCEPEEFDDFMKTLIDEAWEAGYRPKQHLGVGSELVAVKYHLEDMRKIKDQLFDKFLTKTIEDNAK